MACGLALGLLGAGAFFAPSVAGSDLWWHLASGREIWAAGGWPPAGDPFSYTFAGREWMNHEWLWDALFWGLYRLHEQSVALAQLALLFATYGAVGWQAWRVSGSLAAAALALWAAAASAHWFLDLRPHVVTLAFCAALLGTLESRHRLWLWPAGIALWANLHAGFVFGIGAVGLLALVRSAQQSWRARALRLPGREWAIALGCTAALLANPWGWRILHYPLAYLPGLSQSMYHELVEWQAPGLGLAQLDARGVAGWLASFQGRFWVLVALSALGALRVAPAHPYRVALCAVTVLMALRARRFIPLFGVCAAPLAAAALAAGFAALRARAPLALERHGRALTAAAGLGAVAWLWRDARLPTDLLGAWTERDSYPRAAVRYLNALGAPGRVLNYYNWGGYLMLHAPGWRVFIDGRANTLYGEQILRDYSALLQAEPGLSARAQTYRAELALLPSGALSAALRRLDPPWRVLYEDPVAVLLAPPDSPLLRRPLPEPATLLADEPQFVRQQGRQAAGLRQYAAAAGLFERVLELDPQQGLAYAELAEVLALQGDVQGSQQAIERGLRSTRRRSDLLRTQGILLARRGELGPAVRALRASLPGGPFSNPELVHAGAELVRSLQKQLREQAAAAARAGTAGSG